MLFFKQKTAYEMRISDWSSDVCSSDLMRPDADIAAFAEETWVSIKALEQALGLSLQDDIWLFGKTTELLDQRVITQIAGDEGSPDYPLSVHLPLATLVSAALQCLVRDRPAGPVEIGSEACRENVGE